LSLPFTGVEQDWEVELASSGRVNEFVSFYRNSYLYIDEKKALMALIIASYDDLLNKISEGNSNLWFEIEQLIMKDQFLFEELLNYWKLNEENSPENYFKITPLIRSI
jgi:hypothetical protein